MYKITTFVQEELEKAELKELTTQADITYLPSGFVSIKKMMQTLARLKKDWGIKILENEKQYLVEFEDSLRISIDKEHWPHFLTTVLSSNRIAVSPDCNVADLSGYLKEAQVNVLEVALQEITLRIKKMFQTSPLSDALVITNSWSSLFGVVEFSDYSAAIFRVDRVGRGQLPLGKQIEKIMDEISKSYGDDLGSLQMMASALREKTPMNTFAVFDEYDYLYGAKLVSRYRGVLLVFEVNVSMGWSTSQSIYVTDPYLLNKLGEYRDVKVIKNVVFPLGKVFSYKFLQSLRTELDISE